MRVDVHFAVKVTHVVCVPGVICLVKLLVKTQRMPPTASNNSSVSTTCQEVKDFKPDWFSLTRAP